MLGLVAAGLAVASATAWRPADSLVASAQSGATLVMTEPGVLDVAAQQVTLRAQGQGEALVVALGRTEDVEAWIGDDAHTRVTGLQDASTLATRDVAARQPEPDDEAGDEDAEEQAEEDGEEGTEEEAVEPPPDPRGSDLWVTEIVGDGSVDLEWAAEQGRWSVLVATVGEGAEPATLTLTWPQEVRTPWLGPGVAVGIALVLAGALWWVLILREGRPRARRGDREGRGAPGRREEPVAHGAPGRDTSSEERPVRTPAPSAAAPHHRAPSGPAPADVG
ncbi:hypothetical protein N869_10170, partial [Cellulomonas bogoriensis 69B4 = DSM 16987]